MYIISGMSVTIMPSKPVHDTSIVIMASIVFISGVFLGCIKTVLLVIAGMLSGVFLTPDLDLAESRFGIWTLYGKLFKHRGISHVPVIGTLTRLVYILWIPLLIMVIYRVSFDVPWNTVGLLFIGLCIADTLHVTLDKIVTAYKTRSNKWH